MIGVGTPHVRGAGYLEADQNLPPSQREKADVQSCAHCQAVIRMQQWAKGGAWCHKERKPLCLACGKIALTRGCEPIAAKIDAYVERAMREELLDPTARYEGAPAIVPTRLIVVPVTYTPRS